ncbi:MAG: hypothetical protein HYY24_13630 [Verrucomicrobia bacterium]|nr:hypothetical protein [Verrucomicrobiota bacterium]
MLLVLVATEGVAQVATSLAPFPYQNQLYVPAPDPIPGLTQSPQPKGIAIFGGNVGDAGKATTPNNGTIYLVQSGFGQPVAEPRRPDFLIGEEIIPDPALQADLTKSPVIDPPVKAFYIADAGKVFASEAGFVEVTWKRADSTPIEPVKYLIDSLPVRTPVAVYHTHNPTPSPGSDFKTDPLPIPQTKAPIVDVSGVQQIVFHWNTALPEDLAVPYFVRTPTGNLFAKDRLGLMLLEYRENGQFAGIEIVALRSNLTLDGPPTLTDIGSKLLPFTRPLNPVPPVVIRGLGTGSPETQFVHQHINPASPQNVSLFAIRRTANPEDIEIYWMTRSVKNVVWPYELHRYTADWPTDPAKYQIYVRGTGAVLGPDVTFPEGRMVTLMPFQEPSGHANPVLNNSFSTTKAGLSLLKYEEGGEVSFQVVRSVLHTDPRAFAPGTPALIPANIGEEIVEPAHQGPRVGYLHVPEGDRYDPEIYDGAAGDPPEFKTQQIFAVNTGILEVWWANLNQGVQWPSFVKRYQAGWPANPGKIIIASLKGGGPIDRVTQKDYRLYVQNEVNLPGFNPNDEHALIRDGGAGEAVFALRDDLGTPETSEPYALLKYRDAAAALQWKYTVYQVVAEEAPFFFDYPGVAGTLIQAPFPLSLFQSCPQSTGVSGPFFRDRKLSFWARAAGDDGGPAQIVLRYFYPVQLGFFFPDPQPPPPGACVPWLDRRLGGTLGIPTDIKYTITWPAAPELRVAETLVKAKFGLPNISLQTSVEIIYQQSVALNGGSEVRLIDPTREYQVDLARLPSDLPTATERGLKFFPTLPPQLRTRISYDPVNLKLKFKGQFVEPPAGEYYLLLNVITAREKAILLDSSTDATFRSAVNALSAATATVTDVPPDSNGFDSLALTAGFANGTGYVTLAFSNNPKLSAPAEPISLAVIKVECPTYRGELKVIESDNPFDEKLTLRHSGDFAGRTDSYVFEWRTRPPVDGLPPTDPPEQWAIFQPNPATGEGAVDITIQGPGLFTLTDNYFICRYRPISSPLCASAADPEGWSDWTAPMLAEGWIKRVLRGINPFEQKFKSYQDDQVNTIVSMISQAGTPFVGAAPLNQEAANQLGLIEVYETVLRRGRSFSVDGLPAVNYGPANDALLLAAGRLADLYMLLGNEGYADASDPTIAFGTDDRVYGSEASSIHCFLNQTASLIEEELALLRGRDNARLPSVTTYPFYNRLIWNFTSDITGGEVAYALNYNIRNESGDVSGTIDEADAKVLYPQGHGDAWGHYLSAIKNYYRLLRNPNFTWVPRIEAVLVGGVPVSVDFFDERKFAAAAAARARTGAEIVSLTYRDAYVEDPEGQWQGYQDPQKDRAWGLAEWGSRAGQGAYFDWVAANALLPDKDLDPSHTGIQKIDRTTVSELRDIASSIVEIQTRLDSADSGLNPLGLAKNVVPFDIDPSGISQGRTHFEQVFDRAVKAMNNAIAVFNHANNSSQLLRRQADSVADFQKLVTDREADFNSRLIEVFGYPYPDDIGPTGTYPTGYDGPDLYHFDYVDASELLGETPPPTQTLTVRFKEFTVGSEGQLNETTRDVSFEVSSQALGFVKPAAWKQKRRAPGEIQMARSDLLQTHARFRKALVEYKNLIQQIVEQAASIRAQHGVKAEEISILRGNKLEQEGLNTFIAIASGSAALQDQGARLILNLAEADAEALPKSAGISSDVTSAARGAIKHFGAMVAQSLSVLGDFARGTQLHAQQQKEIASLEQQIDLTTLRNEQAIANELRQLKVLILQTASSELEILNANEVMQQAAGRYLAALAKGQRLLEDRLRFRQETAAQIQAYRYKDMAFRIFRNDALQKYRAQFDLAAMYVYLAARAYDYETNLRKGDPRGPGSDFMTSIVGSRSLGLIIGGQPQTGGSRGDPGLADPMARMGANWELVLKGQLGFNNPQTETGRFSLRSELLRIQSGVGGRRLWREALERNVVPNLLDVAEFKRFCIPFQPQQPVEPAVVIPFATSINFGHNLFGWPAGGGDNNYDSTHFATKIRSVGVWFSGYNNLGGGMVNTPRVYLVPVGNDIMRSPSGNVGDIREWKILDQKLPVPFPLSGASLADPAWIPMNDSLADELAAIRQFAQFRAFHDSGSFNPAETINDSRLIGRSVWNTRWLLIIPAGNLHSDRNEGLQRFINGALRTDGTRDGNGVSDIKIFFQTYAYSGN